MESFTKYLAIIFVYIKKVSIFERYSEYVGMKMKIMKRVWLRYILVCVVGITAHLTAVAQERHFHTHDDDAPRIRTEFGVGLGGVYTGFSNVSTESIKLSPRFGFSGHLDMALRIGRWFAVETEVAYQGGSIDVTNGREDRRIRTRTIDIPVLLSLRLANNMVRISAGPLFTVMSRGEYVINEESKMFGPVTPTWNMAAGIGVKVARNFLIEARYTHSLKEELNQFEGEEFNTRSYRIAAGVTLIF